jgi:calcineurin-like phosphoesterase family protein
MSTSYYGHANIIKYCNRPFSSIEEMDEEIIKRHNEVAPSDGTVIHAGDFTLANVEIANQYIKRLNGHHIFLRGSHDKWLKANTKVHEIWCNKIEDLYVVVCHYAMRVWPRSHYNSCQLFGHCLDFETEILTLTGWKNRNNILQSDIVATINCQTKYLEYNPILEIIDIENYCGNVYSIFSRGVNFRVTENHTMLDLGREHKRIRKFTANQFAEIDNRLIIQAVCKENTLSDGISLKPDMIKLLIWITADGNLCNTDLIRIGLTKERKIQRIEQLLYQLEIPYRKLPQKYVTCNISFTLPEELRTWRLKPLDNQFILVNQQQLDIILDEYSHTDGQKINNSYVIYTSKKIEADIIQHMCVINGYRCTVTKRDRDKSDGVNRKPNYMITIIKSDYRCLGNVKALIQIEHVKNEHFWCLTVPNGTLITRRKGRVLIVGNSHGKLEPIGKQLDIGVDLHNFYPYSFEEIKSIMAKRPDNPNLVRKN